MKRRGGFTLIELVIVIAIGVILGTIGLVSLSGYRRQQSLRLASQSIVTFLKDAQSRSISQEGGLRWGVRFDNLMTGRDNYLLVSGPPFGPAGSTVALPASIEFQDPLDGTSKAAVFSNTTGLPTSSVTIIIRLIGSSTTKTITVNAQGTITEN